MRRFSPAVFLILAGFSLPLGAQQTREVTAQEKAAALGAHLASEVRSRTDAVRIATLDRYLAGLGQRLAAGFPNGPAHWEFTVVKQTGDRSHEPLGLPAGYVFVPASLIAAVQNEDELAAMLAHAMATAVSPDLLTWNRAGTDSQMATIPLLFVDLELGSDGSTLVPLSLSATQQNHTMEADATAVQTLSEVGFDPQALLTYLERVQAKSTAPSKREMETGSARLERLRHTLGSLTPGPGRRSSSASFAVIQEQVRNEERASMTPAKLPSLLSPSK